MTEEKPEQPKPQPVTLQVKLLKRALELSEQADSYKADVEMHYKSIVILKDEGRTAVDNTLLAQYIAKAERDFVIANGSKIVALASANLKKDIEEIRSLVND